MSSDNEWELFQTFTDIGSAEVMCAWLLSEEVPARVDTHSFESSLETKWPHCARRGTVCAGRCGRAIVAAHSTESLDVMSGDLAGVELAMALEEALLNGDKQVSALKPYLLDAPVELLCVRGGFETEVVVYAKHGHTAFFVATDSAQFGIGTTDEYGDVVDAYHYPTLAMALRAFVGAANRA